MDSSMARGKHRRYMELVAYHIYHLEERRKEIPWREVTTEMIMIKKYEDFNKKYVSDYIRKNQENNQDNQNGCNR